jgi:hypothetical protein
MNLSTMVVLPTFEDGNRVRAAVRRRNPKTKTMEISHLQQNLEN